MPRAEKIEFDSTDKEGPPLSIVSSHSLQFLEKENLLLPSTSLPRIQSVLAAQDSPSSIGAWVDLSIFHEGDKNWLRAKKRFEAVTRFLNDPEVAKDLKEHAKAVGVHFSTLYRWLHKHLKGDGTLPDHLDSPRLNVKSKFPKEVEDIIAEAIDKVYLCAEKPTIQRVWERVEQKCLLKGFETPHINTIRLRIAKLPEELTTCARLGKRAATVRFTMHKKGFPPVDGPLKLVQIDHTPVDLMIVSEDERESIGRVYITVVFDTYSRMVLGIFISLDEPSALSVGLALLHAILPKKPWLDELGVDVDWPCQGLPVTAYVDNAMEFRGKMLRLWAEMYGCDLQFRPTKTPETGGHIERFMRTLATAVHDIPGTTFSNIKERGDYKPSEKACMTLRELEAWLARWISLYHISPHAGLGGLPPIEKWRQWFHSQEAVSGEPVTVQTPDPMKLRMALLPYAERTIQQYGVQMFGEYYYGDVLRSHVHSKDAEDSRRQEKFIFRYDPRDISRIYFWEPGTHQYYQIAWRDPSRRPCSLWEQRARVTKIKEINKAGVDRMAIAMHREDLDERVKSSKTKTMSQRRSKARKQSHHSENIHQLMPKGASTAMTEQASPQAPDLNQSSMPVQSWPDLQPYSEIE